MIVKHLGTNHNLPEGTVIVGLSKDYPKYPQSLIESIKNDKTITEQERNRRLEDVITLHNMNWNATLNDKE